MQKILFSTTLFGVLAVSVFGIDTTTFENIQTSEDVMYTSESSKSEGSLDETLRQNMKQDEILFDLPIFDSTVTLDARNLNDEVINFKLNFGSVTEEQARKKSKIKKIFIPILVFLLLKAMTLIPLGLGVLGIKTWNAIQLSFISFVSALIMGIWKLCTKINHEPHPQIIHNAWDSHYHDRSDYQQMPYSAYERHNAMLK